MIQVKTKIDSKSQRSISKFSRIVYWVILALGLVMLGFYILQTFVWHSGDYTNLSLGLFCTVFAVLMEIMLYSQIKDVEQSRVVYEYDFELGFVKVTKFRNGENMGTVKYYYDDMSVITEDKDYVFLKYSSMLVFPVDKQNIASTDMVALRKILNLKEKEEKIVTKQESVQPVKTQNDVKQPAKVQTVAKQQQVKTQNVAKQPTASKKVAQTQKDNQPIVPKLVTKTKKDAEK